MSNRILVNVVVLAVIGSAFFAITSVINLMAWTEVAEEHEFSFVKRSADGHFDNRNWTAASRYYKKMAESDTFNCGAHLQYALCLSNQILPHLTELKSTSDSKQIDKLKREFEPLVTDAIVAYEKILKFPQFRNYARVQLASLHGYRGDSERAVDFLKKALQDGHDTRGLIRKFAFFQCSDVYFNKDIQTLVRARNVQPGR